MVAADLGVRFETGDGKVKKWHIVGLRAVVVLGALLLGALQGQELGTVLADALLLLGGHPVAPQLGVEAPLV